MYQSYCLNYDDIMLLVDVLVLTSLDYAKESIIDAVIVTGFVPFLYNEEHLMNLSEVLQRLQNHGERLKLEKCCFMEDSVEYLGHRVDSKGLHTTDSKLKAIVDAPSPRNAQELRAFLGLLNYYGRFIPN